MTDDSEDWTPGPKTREILEILPVLIDAMNQLGQKEQFRSLAKMERCIRNSDYSGILYLLGLEHKEFTGFNYDNRRNGAALSREALGRLSKLESRLFKLAREIREENTPPRRYLKKSRPWNK